MPGVIGPVGSPPAPSSAASNRDCSVPDAKDAWIGYSGFNSLKLKTGQFLKPFGLEAQTSNKYITFMERAQHSTLVPFRSPGMGISVYGNSWILSTGLSGKPIDKTREGDERFSATGRYSYYFQNEIKKQTLHLGASLSHRHPDNDRKSIRYRATPESHVTEISSIDTRRTVVDAAGTVEKFNVSDINYINLLGLEAATVLGPFPMQSEYVRSQVGRDNRMNDLDFDGGYIYGSFFVTGESRNYNPRTGLFSRVVPDRNVGDGKGIGTWEIGLR